MNQQFGLALQAWFLGLAVLAVIVLPGAVVLDGILTDPFLKTLPVRLLGYLAMLLPSFLMTLTFGVMLSAPLFGLGFLASLCCRSQIARQPLLFAGLAPAVAVAIFALVDALLRRGGGFRLPLWEHALATALRPDSLIVALPVAVGSLYFCLHLARLVKAESTRPTHGTG